MGHASKERVLLIGTDQRITSGPAATTAASRGRIHGCTRIVSRKVRFFSLAPRAPSIHGTKCECRLVPVTAASRGEAAGVVAVRQRREMTQPGHAGCSATSQRPGSPLTPLLLHARHRPSAWIGGGAKIGFESWGGRGSPRLLFSVIGGSRPA